MREYDLRNRGRLEQMRAMITSESSRKTDCFYDPTSDAKLEQKATIQPEKMHSWMTYQQDHETSLLRYLAVAIA